jgi:RimJ/RimL family protein N-acetyltransferase
VDRRTATPRLRPARPEDRPRLLGLARHPDVTPSVMVGADGALGEALDRVFAGAEDEGVLVIEDDGRDVGVVRWQARSRRSRIATIYGLMVDPAARGRGLASAAVELVCAELFGTLGFHRVEAEVYGFNEGGLRAFERAGFTREGTRRRAYDRHGGWQDGVMFARLDDD